MSKLMIAADTKHSKHVDTKLYRRPKVCRRHLHGQEKEKHNGDDVKLHVICQEPRPSHTLNGQHNTCQQEYEYVRS